MSLCLTNALSVYCLTIVSDVGKRLYKSSTQALRYSKTSRDNSPEKEGSRHSGNDSWEDEDVLREGMRDRGINDVSILIVFLDSQLLSAFRSTSDWERAGRGRESG